MSVLKITVPDQIARAVRIAALLRGVSPSVIVEQAVGEFLIKNPEPKTPQDGDGDAD